MGPLTYKALIRAAQASGFVLSRTLDDSDHVGVFMPTSCAAVVLVFGVQLGRRVPAMLPIQADIKTLEAACELSRLTTIITSRAFIKKAKLDQTIKALQKSRRVLFVEDLRQDIRTTDKAAVFLRGLVPPQLVAKTDGERPALILFTSGTTGTPKGVVLSHENVLANIQQVQEHLPLDESWNFFNVLPVFHAFGLVGGTLLPILSGLKSVLYPSPLDRIGVVQAIQRSEAKVLVATDSFAQLYAKTASAGALRSLKYVVLGGERVTEPTIRKISGSTDAEIIQGYGSTECSPVIAMNRPGANRLGTVGRLLPGLVARLTPIPELTGGAELSVKGPNVMLGYLAPDGSGHIIPPKEGWFDTGDVVAVDTDGFLTIIDRRKRFAKVGGELVSLDVVEANAEAAWPGKRHAAIILLDQGGKDLIVLVTEQENADRTELAHHVNAHNLPPKALPKKLVVIPKIPLLPTGKPDYLALRTLCEAVPGSSSEKEISGDTGNCSST
ncbi:MAG: AMP-binding protein [Henriciella sp.]|nr:AMP-binding protein [Henriciella sp.]